MYGSPRLTRALHARGVPCSENTVAKVLRTQGLSAVRRRRVRPPQSQAAAIEPLHVLNREFTAATPNTKWTSDLTYLWTSAGWVYLAVVLDLFSRKVVGWAMSGSPDAELVGRAFRSAVARRRPPAGVLVHSDRGCQYPSADSQLVLASAEVVVSFSRKGNCWDNAPTESFFASLKKELWHRRSCADAELRLPPLRPLHRPARRATRNLDRHCLRDAGDAVALADGVKSMMRDFAKRHGAKRVLLYYLGPLSGACFIGHQLFGTNAR